MKAKKSPLVGIIMGSDSDWPTLQVAAEVCREFAVPFEVRVVSAHRTPADMARFIATTLFASTGDVPAPRTTAHPARGDRAPMPPRAIEELSIEELSNEELVSLVRNL